MEPGDFIPLFEAVDSAGGMRGMELYGGQHCMLFFLPADAEYLRRFFARLDAQFGKAKYKRAWQVFVVGGTPEKLAALKTGSGIKHSLWADPEHKIARVFGVEKAAGYVLDTILRVVRRHVHDAPEALASAVVEDCQAVAAYRQKNAAPRVVTDMAPALIIPNALSPELCEKCIKAFQTGRTFEGTVGAAEKVAYRPNSKVRTDYIVSGALLDELDEAMARRVFPEIKKIFGLEAAYREIYKVGSYKGEKGGFFKAHRDNFEAELGYRRIAMTINLNDDYEGGGLKFPEYGEDVYRPVTGGAVAFSCATLHEAKPVTAGERLILVCFFHGEEEEAFRRHYLASKGLPLKIKDYTPKLPPEPNILQGRDFFKNWRRKHVKFEGD